MNTAQDIIDKALRVSYLARKAAANCDTGNIRLHGATQAEYDRLYEEISAGFTPMDIFALVHHYEEKIAKLEIESQHRELIRNTIRDIVKDELAKGVI